MTTVTEEQSDTAVAKRADYKPTEPVGDARNLKRLLDANSPNLTSLLPKHVTPDRLIKTMLVAANRTPDLLQCTQASVFETITRAAELGLDLSGTLGEAYPVPFNNRIKVEGRDVWVKQCTLIIGYRGLAKLARQAGEVSTIRAEVVFEADTLDWVDSPTDGKFVFKRALQGDRGKAIGAFAYVVFKDGGWQADYMTHSEIEDIRKRSKSGTDKNGNPAGPWKTDWPEMAKKTVFRRLAKWLPMSAEKSDLFQQAVELDNSDYNLGDAAALVPSDGTPRSQSLAKRLQGNQDVIDADTTPADESAPDIEDTPELDPRQQCIAALMDQGHEEAEAVQELERLITNNFNIPPDDATATELRSILDMINDD